ncbi:RNA polymerase sigma factor, sigma-70 family [Pleurocapsa sp. PCC 7327]|uniref:sigma-70 family RNA polymerase sigma factor n=1 Tax=Pleurocapsa sp. PCC 7327 TaxID=118163 RepID=UPI00029F8387|nr:sigma-70 family RNA polymerase sigma factor [Pleurocapsa sp. PCC 7327]AFY78806.1 RNA polymerase sigma factor, sigma-70 family [Pleurocapsa sp. PCC 7327]
MHPRQSLIEIFSTFAQFEAEQFSRWVTDLHLRRSMQNCLERGWQADSSENFWWLYWYKVWQSQPAPKKKDDLNKSHARSHLTAYLQEACYWAAQKAIANFSKTQYTLPDGFQVAIAQIEKVLKGFSLERGFNLKNYASIIFANIIRENLRQRQEIDICTPWAILRKLSQKRLVESLEAIGLTSEAIASYLLAWKCFKTLYVPSIGETSTRQLNKPDRSTWEAIASLYNKERPPSEPEGTPETLEQWLLDCAKAARSYLYPTLTSLNAPTPGQESGELQDYLPATESESLLADAIAAQEERTRLSQQTQLNEILSAALTGMDAEAQHLLQLYYGRGLKQQEIAEQLETKQYAVSRRLAKAKQSLLLTLARWSQEQLHISLASDVLDNISKVLEEWLSTRYSQTNS